MSCPKIFGAIWIIILLLSIPIVEVRAARSMSIISPSASLFGEEEMVVTASISGFTDGETIYIKGAFFETGTTNYFGYTKSGESWVKNSASNANQRAVTIGTWDGTLIVKSDFSDSGYKGEGEYLFKIRYYYGSFTGEWSTNIAPVTINEPDPTLTPTPTIAPTPNPTVASTHTPYSTQSIAPTATIVSKKTSTPTRKPTVIIEPTVPSISDILGVSESATREAIATDLESQEPDRSLVFSLLIIGTGLGLLSFALAIKKTDIWKKQLDTS